MEYCEGRDEMRKCAKVIAEEAKMVEMMLGSRSFDHGTNHVVVSSCMATIKGSINIIETQMQVGEK